MRQPREYTGRIKFIDSSPMAYRHPTEGFITGIYVKCMAHTLEYVIVPSNHCKYIPKGELIGYRKSTKEWYAWILKGRVFMKAPPKKENVCDSEHEIRILKTCQKARELLY